MRAFRALVRARIDRGAVSSAAVRELILGQSHEQAEATRELERALHYAYVEQELASGRL